MKKAISFLLVLIMVTSLYSGPIYAEATPCLPTAQAECEPPAEPAPCEEDDDCDPCVPWTSWYCGMSYAVIGLGVAAVAAVAAIVLASGDSGDVVH